MSILLIAQHYLSSFKVLPLILKASENKGKGKKEILSFNICKRQHFEMNLGIV